MITRCPKCTGKKIIMGLGSMIKTCPECDGVGHVKVTDKVEKDTMLNMDSVNKSIEDHLKIDKRTKAYKAHIAEQAGA